MIQLKIAVVGYGNIGKYAAQAVLAAPDMELVGIVRRDAAPIAGLPDIPVARNIEDLGNVDVALLCVPTRSVEQYAVNCLKRGINTVDSFDIHSKIWELRGTLDTAAKEGGACAILSAGWDPGSDSVIRALLEACAPRGITYTNFGPGMSMGHTVAVKAIPGVAGALSMTIPTGTGIHRRMVYVQLQPGANLGEVTAAINSDPYFTNDETHVIQVDDISNYTDAGHAAEITRKGASGASDNQNFRFTMSVNNPALTSQVMVSCARASAKQQPGAYTMIEIPVIDLLPGGREAIVRRLV